MKSMNKMNESIDAARALRRPASVANLLMKLERMPCRHYPALDVNVNPTCPRRVRVSGIMVSVVKSERTFEPEAQRRDPAHI